MLISGLILVLSLFIDRLVGDPQTRLHPVSLIGQFIGWWGRPDRYPLWMQRGAGCLFWCGTVLLFSTPFILFQYYAPWYLYLAGAPFLLKSCFALRALEEHAIAVSHAVNLEASREKAGMLVSRETTSLSEEQVLSAAYESVAENLNDSIIAPLFYFALFGLAGAAVYRAANTMDAMLGYTDERTYLGWFSARMDDILSYIPARICGFLLIIRYAPTKKLSGALRIFRRDRFYRPGFNGGIPMSLIAGGEGILFEKPGKYQIGEPFRSLRTAGPDILFTVRITTVLFVIFAGTALILSPLLTKV